MIKIKLSYKLIYVLIFFILSIFEQQLWKKILIKSYIQHKEPKKMKYADMNLIFFISFIKIFSMIFFYIENYLIKTKIKKNNKINDVYNNTNKFHINIETESKKHLCKEIFKEKKFLILIFLCEFLFYFLEFFIVYLNFNTLFDKNPIDIFLCFTPYIVCFIFSYFFFKTKPQRHHILCLILYFIADIILCVYFKFTKKKYSNIFLKTINDMFLLYSKSIIFFTQIIKLCIEKYIMEKYFFSLYLIISIEGIFGLIISFFYFIIGLIFNLTDFDSIIDFYKNLFNKDNYLPNYILFLIISYCLILMTFIINYHKGPAYVLLAHNYYFIEDFYYFFTGLTVTNNTKNKVGIEYIFRDLLTLITVSIYAEVLILEIFGLNKNTNFEIDKRAKLEYEISLSEIKT